MSGIRDWAFCKNSQKQLKAGNYFHKTSTIIDVWQGSKIASAPCNLIRKKWTSVEGINQWVKCHTKCFGYTQWCKPDCWNDQHAGKFSTLQLRNVKLISCKNLKKPESKYKHQFPCYLYFPEPIFLDSCNLRRVFCIRCRVVESAWWGSQLILFGDFMFKGIKINNIYFLLLV